MYICTYELPVRKYKCYRQLHMATLHIFTYGATMTKELKINYTRQSSCKFVFEPIYYLHPAMSKPLYPIPPVEIETFDFRTDEKRNCLNFKISKIEKRNIIVILKNHTRVMGDISHKTIFTFINNIHKNRFNCEALKNVGCIPIVNLVPYFETYPENIAKNKINIFIEENMKVTKDVTSQIKNIKTAEGNAPCGFFSHYEKIKLTLRKILKSNKDSIYSLNNHSIEGNPKHVQVWSYQNKHIHK